MILSGDCVEVMRGLPDESVDAIVTDPPYGLGFMGKAWDDLPPGLEWAQECLRVLKPGGHLLAFGGSRTYHRLAVAVEDAGFEVRDQMMWLYGSGFPKSLDVSKAIDKRSGKEGEFGAPKSNAHAGWIERGAMRGKDGHGGYQRPWMEDASAVDRNARQYLPATADAKKWSGWGTALKPAHEPIVVARKPLVGTVAENVLKFGTGALNVDGCRIGIAEGDEPAAGHRTATFGTQETESGGDGSGGWIAASGRWPANLILDEEAGRLLDEQSGEGKDGVAVRVNGGGNQFGIAALGVEKRAAAGDYGYGGSGGASRFFYCAKAGKAERNAGLDGFEERDGGAYAGGAGMPGRTQINGEWVQTDLAQRLPRANVHPTVKPISLMAYLVRLVTPPGGTVLDPFLGSGTTGCAAALEGFDFIGIEREPDYIAIAEARIAWWEKHKGDAQVGDILAAGKGRDEVEDAGQLDLLADAA